MNRAPENRTHSRRPAVAWAFAMAAMASLAVASQPTPPITLEITEETAGRADGVVAVVTITAHEPVARATFSIVSSDREALRVDAERRELRVEPGKPETLRIPLTAARAGAHRFEIRVQADARGWESAGNVERRYVVYDGSRPPRILTGGEVRREQRLDVDRRLRDELRRDPNAKVGIETYLRRPLRKLPRQPAADDKAQQALAPPAGGIEPYEAGVVVDSTADVVRKLDPLTITGRMFFTDRGGSLRPLINATIDVRDSDTFGDEQLISVVTGWDGRYTAVVNNDDGWLQNGRDIYVRVRSTNSRFRVQDCAAWPDWTYSWVSDVRDDLSDGTVVDFGDLATGENNEASILFQDLNQGWNFLTTAGAQDPGFVDLCWPEGSSAYSTFWEEIDIEDGDEVARDIVLHEYGHATMHNAYDGYWPSNTGGPHGFNDILHRNMAFTEGWGTFIALAINDDGTYHSTGFSRAIEAFNHSANHTDGDGQVNEGHVAAGLHDVRDARAEGSCANGGTCDPSGANSAAMAQIWRDSFWRSDSDDVAQYWSRLCPELSNAQAEAAVQALTFDEIDLATCKCTVRFALADAPSSAAAVESLRELRDRGLRNTALGQRVIELYYRHTDEVTALLQKDGELRLAAATLLTRAVEGYRTLKKGAEPVDVLLDERHARLAHDFLARVQSQASPELQRDFDEVHRLVDQLQGRTYDEVRRKFEQHDRTK